MSSGRTVLVIGPGSIGLTVREGHNVTGYVRLKEQCPTNRAVGVLGDLNDAALITKHTLDHDIVFHTATADHQLSTEAIIEGLRQRASGGKSTRHIHTSGTGVLHGKAEGAFKTNPHFFCEDGYEASWEEA